MIKLGKHLRRVIFILAVVFIFTACGKTTQTEQEMESQEQAQETMDTEDITEAKDTTDATDAKETKQTKQTAQIEETKESEVEKELVFEEVNETVYVTATSVNMSDSFSEESQVVQTLKKRAQIHRTGYHSEWSKVVVDGKEGYVASEFLTTDVPESGRVIAIDAGHQLHGNSEQEPIGPGASTTKAKVTSGTSGCSTGLNEYELNLTVSLKLKEELINRGYEIVMIRETHEVDMSNSERAAMANNSGAEIFVRIHANSDNDSGIHGILTMCPTANNPYVSNLYSESKDLSSAVVNGMVAATGAANRGVLEMDNMSGINWCQIPVTIVEMGFMSNPAEDQLLADDSYQNKMVQGIANGIDEYFGSH